MRTFGPSCRSSARNSVPDVRPAPRAGRPGSPIAPSHGRFAPAAPVPAPRRTRGRRDELDIMVSRLGAGRDPQRRSRGGGGSRKLERNHSRQLAEIVKFRRWTSGARAFRTPGPERAPRCSLGRRRVGASRIARETVIRRTSAEVAAIDGENARDFGKSVLCKVSFGPSSRVSCSPGRYLGNTDSDDRGS
jgi:hypothetical protein